MNTEPLMRAVVDAAVFLSLSDDHVVQPDAAVAQLELMAATLRRLNERERSEFRSFVQQLAQQEASEAGRTPMVEFLFTLTENLGLD